MKNINRKNILKRISIITLIAGAWLLLSAFKLTAVELKNADKPFIDLGKEVVDSEDIGLGGIEETGLEGAAKENRDTQPQIDINVEVTERGIQVNGTVCLDPDEMLRKVKSLHKNGMRVHLIDNYAEAHTYTSVKEKLKEAKLSFLEETKK